MMLLEDGVEELSKEAYLATLLNHLIHLIGHIFHDSILALKDLVLYQGYFVFLYNLIHDHYR